MILGSVKKEEISGVPLKAMTLRNKVLSYFASVGDSTIAELCKELNASAPTIAKIIGELIDEGYVLDYGKIETEGGRRPNRYGLDPNSGFFLGVEIKHKSLDFALIDLKRNLVNSLEKVPFKLSNDRASLDALCGAIEGFLDRPEIDRKKVGGIGLNITGRVNSRTGFSYSYFHFEEQPLSRLIETRIGIPCFVENDTRAMTCGEYALGVVRNEKDVLFVNISRGLGLGVVLGGLIQYGKSGFAGEFGHIPFFENDIICHCGKKGCLETEVSGVALERMCRAALERGTGSILSEKHKKGEAVSSDDIVEAANNGDVMAMDLLAALGDKLGKGIALLINLFNPELVVLGGTLSAAGDALRLPVRSAVNKYALNLVQRDVKLKNSALGDQAGVIGACLLVRNKMLGLKTL